MRTQVGIIGAGPAGLMLSHLLHVRGIDSVVLESRSRDHVEQRVRAGVLEAGTVDLLVANGVGERLQREGLVHRGIELRFAGRSHRIDFEELTGGKTVTVYGQQEVVKDLIAARLAAGGDIRFEAPVTSIAGLDGETPSLEFGGETPGRLTCDYVAGCDGFHGLSREAIPNVTTYDRTFPFAWLGILAHSPPVSHELIYTHHERGFALVSMRSPTVTRLYLQCAPGEDPAQWPNERFWNELRARLA
ncbi:MAG: 4-hydroxybenzoate 3-monooxygenase, partial [Candidatus Eremiobacteraeota bacterium]|nr:4-hydroxybenzoate 3-monooxygenase [Candidatus Eremiobacteraeota bacterium]